MKESYIKYTCDFCGKVEKINQNPSYGIRVGYKSPIINWYKMNKHSSSEKNFCCLPCLQNHTHRIHNDD